jgi:hypothetical protein
LRRTKILKRTVFSEKEAGLTKLMDWGKVVKSARLRDEIKAKQAEIKELKMKLEGTKGTLQYKIKEIEKTSIPQTLATSQEIEAVKNDKYFKDYMDMIAPDGKVKTLAQRDKSYGWSDTTYNTDRTYTVRSKGERGIDSEFMADTNTIKRFLKGNPTADDIMRIKNDINNFRENPSFRDYTKAFKQIQDNIDDLLKVRLVTKLTLTKLLRKMPFLLTNSDFAKKLLKI